MSDIRLHPEKGVNPRVTTCSGCGADVGVVLLGLHDWVETCDRCDGKLLGTRRCECGGWGRDRKTIPDHAKLPLDLCTDCKAAQDAASEAVQAGGIFWRCSVCRSEGAIRSDSELAHGVRAQMGIEPPEPCGIEFHGAPHCPLCSDESAAAAETKSTQPSSAAAAEPDDSTGGAS